MPRVSIRATPKQAKRELKSAARLEAEAARVTKAERASGDLDAAGGAHKWGLARRAISAACSSLGVKQAPPSRRHISPYLRQLSCISPVHLRYISPGYLPTSPPHLPYRRASLRWAQSPCKCSARTASPPRTKTVTLTRTLTLTLTLTLP